MIVHKKLLVSLSINPAKPKALTVAKKASISSIFFLELNPFILKKFPIKVFAH